MNPLAMATDGFLSVSSGATGQTVVIAEDVFAESLGEAFAEVLEDEGLAVTIGEGEASCIDIEVTAEGTGEAESS